MTELDQVTGYLQAGPWKLDFTAKRTDETDDEGLTIYRAQIPVEAMLWITFYGTSHVYVKQLPARSTVEILSVEPRSN